MSQPHFVIKKGSLSIRAAVRELIDSTLKIDQVESANLVKGIYSGYPAHLIEKYGKNVVKL
jgi:hypothetical protein